MGGGSKGCKTKLVWTDWSHIMLNHEITATPEGAKGRIYLVQLGMRGPGTIERHGGYEDIYVKTAEGWRIKSRTHVRNKAWHAEALRTPDSELTLRRSGCGTKKNGAIATIAPQTRWCRSRSKKELFWCLNRPPRLREIRIFGHFS